MANEKIPHTRKCTWDLTYSANLLHSTNMPDIVTFAVSISNIATSTATAEVQSVRSKTGSKEWFRY